MDGTDIKYTSPPTNATSTSLSLSQHYETVVFMMNQGMKTPAEIQEKENMKTGAEQMPVQTAYLMANGNVHLYKLGCRKEDMGKNTFRRKENIV